MNAFKQIRKQNNMSIEELSKRIQVPEVTIRIIEKVSRPVPSLHFLSNFKAVFNVTDEDIQEASSTQ